MMTPEINPFSPAMTSIKRPNLKSLFSASLKLFFPSAVQCEVRYRTSVFIPTSVSLLYHLAG